jgi:hypothetical protein
MTGETDDSLSLVSSKKVMFPSAHFDIGDEIFATKMVKPTDLYQAPAEIFEGFAGEFAGVRMRGVPKRMSFHEGKRAVEVGDDNVATFGEDAGDK